MKKLFLTSAGFINQEISNTFLAELPKPVSEIKTLIVAYAQNSNEEFYVNESKDELQKLGIQNITIINMHHVVNVESLGNFDVIYVCGGNTFAIFNKLRETGLDKFIVNQVNSGAIYVGVSAGSIIAGPDIEIAGWGSEGDKNEIGLKDFKGFHFVDIAVFPHFHEELRNEVKEFRDKVNYKVIELTNDQAVFVKNDDSKIIGSYFPFKSFSEDEFKIVEVKPCAKKFLFHASGKKLEKLDPKYNRKLDGVIAGDFNDPNAQVISEIKINDLRSAEKFVTADKSSGGRGGMLTKFAMARKMISAGITVFMLNGKKQNGIVDIFEGKQLGTKFSPHKKVSSRKRRIAHGDSLARGSVVVNKCFEDQIFEDKKAMSLLPVGILSATGEFKKGDIVKITTEKGRVIGCGISKSDMETINKIAGTKGGKAVVHYDDLFVY